MSTEADPLFSMKDRSPALARWLLRLSVVAIVSLTFVWPFVFAPDPADPSFRIAAIATLIIFLGSVVALAVRRLRQG